MRRQFDGSELTLADERGRRVSVRLDGWRDEDVPASPYDSGHGEAAMTGTVGEITVPDTNVVVHRGDDPHEITRLVAPVVRIKTPACIRVDTVVGIEIHVVGGTDRVRVSTSGGRPVINFGDGNRGAIRLAHEGANSETRPVVTVPRTVEGVATALSTVHGTTNEFSPDRTLPAMRSPPAELQFGETESIPESLRGGGSEVVVTTPPSLDRLAVVAPLVQYVGATVRVEDGASVRIDTGDSVYEFDRDGIELGVGRVLRAVFGLDCLARCGGPNEPGELTRLDVLDRAGLSDDDLYDRPIEQRIDAYLSRLGEGRVPVDEFPEWHFWLSIQPSYDRLPALVASLEHLPAVESVTEPHESWDRSELGTTDDDYSDIDVDLVNPELEAERTHAWLADGVPVGGIKLLPSAVTGDQTPVVEPDVVVVNNLEMDAEADAVLRSYRRLTEEEGGSCRIERDLSPTELREVIESRADHLHFVGHCNAEGIRCDEEHLPIEEIRRTEIDSFVLNACDSVELGRRLVERGATVGITTTRKVVTTPARAAGRECVRFLVNGWPIARAIERAERAVSDTDTGYVTVGDGTYAITGTDATLPPSVEIESPGAQSGQYTVSTTFDHPIEVGISMHLPDPFDDRRWLPGSGRTHELTRRELWHVLDQLDSAVVFDDDLRWPEEVDI